MKIWMSLTVVLCLHYDVDHHHRHQCINEAVFICVYPLLWSLGINGQTVLCQSTHATYTFKLFYEAIRGTFKNFVTWYRWASWMSLIPLHWLVQSVSTILHDLLFGYWYWRRTVSCVARCCFSMTTPAQCSHVISSTRCHMKCRCPTTPPPTVFARFGPLPSDFYLFPKLKEFIKGRKFAHDKNEDVICTVIGWLKNQDQQFLYN